MGHSQFYTVNGKWVYFMDVEKTQIGTFISTQWKMRWHLWHLRPLRLLHYAYSFVILNIIYFSQPVKECFIMLPKVSIRRSGILFFCNLFTIDNWERGKEVRASNWKGWNQKWTCSFVSLTFSLFFQECEKRVDAHEFLTLWGRFSQAPVVAAGPAVPRKCGKYGLPVVSAFFLAWAKE